MSDKAISTSDVVNAWERFDGDNVDTFFWWWDLYLAGKDFPCPESPSGIHQVTDGSCDLCGDKNRSS